MAGKRKTGRWLTIWLPDEDCWVIQALEVIRRRFEQKGTPMSQAAVVSLEIKKSDGKMVMKGELSCILESSF